MYWIVVHSFSASLGQKGQHTKRYALITEYVSKKYGKAVVFFDGYEGKSTKDMTHQRRTKGQTGVTVTFTSDMQLTMKKDRFLANKTNKQQLIKMLSEHLEMRNCEVHHAPGDTDLLIVQKAVETVTRVNTVLVGDDTDLLILLCYHASMYTAAAHISGQSQRYSGQAITFVSKQRYSIHNQLPLKIIIAAGEQALVGIYKGKPGETLDSLRYK